MLQAATDGNKEVKHKEVSSPAHNKNTAACTRHCIVKGKPMPKNNFYSKKCTAKRHGALQRPWYDKSSCWRPCSTAYSSRGLYTSALKAWLEKKPSTVQQ
jgi:hypothetical protein